MTIPSKKTILVVDDEPEVASIIQEVFTDQGYNVITAANGELALALMNAGQTFDMVFSDAKMPKMDGITLLKHIRVALPHIPFCIVSGFSTQTEQEIRALGAIGYISKPFSSEALLKLAEMHLWPSRTDVTTNVEGISIVYVLEDEEVDQELLKRAFSQHDFSNSVALKFFSKGDRLISLLRLEGNHPDLIILDINVPGQSGFEILSQIRKDNLLGSSTKVIMLSSSKLENNRNQSRDLGADCLYAKPASAYGWWHLARAIHQSWLKKEVAATDQAS